MKNFLKGILSLILFLTILTVFPVYSYTISANDSSYIILSHYYKNMDIGDRFYLSAFTPSGKLPSFKSSNSKIASVNKYGMVTAKKAGTAAITVKAKNSSSSCVITVNPTEIRLNSVEIQLEHNQSFKLTAYTSNGTKVKWKTGRKSVASVDADGWVTGQKPGTTVITASADGYSARCSVTVKKPDIRLSHESLSLYRKNSVQITASVSSGIAPKWRSSRSSVASVDSEGIVTAHKNGTAAITAIVDGVSKTCKITVMKPQITISPASLILKMGRKKKITATVSSGNPPDFKSSNTYIASVSPTGCVSALKKGTAYITISEDGTKVKCKITVI